MAIRQEVVGRVLVVTLDNARVKNALDKVTIGALRDLFETLGYRDVLPPDPAEAQENGVWDIGEGGRYRPHVVVLRTAGDVFCAGAHLGEMLALGEVDYQENMTAALDMGAMFRAVRNCAAPVVCRVQGSAFGGGVGLLAACDVVVAEEQTRYSLTEVKLGLVPGVISPLVIGRIGQAAARRLSLTAEVLDAAEALRLGLVDRLASAEALDAAVSSVVTSLLQGGAHALGLCKTLYDGAESLGFARSAELTARMIAEARTNPEAQAALRAFAAREAAPWYDETPWTLPPEA